MMAKVIKLQHPTRGIGIFMSDNMPNDPDWTPLDAVQPVKAQKPAPPTLDELRGIAKDLGVKVDNRWGIDRLRKEIQETDGHGN